MITPIWELSRKITKTKYLAEIFLRKNKVYNTTSITHKLEVYKKIKENKHKIKIQ